MPIAIEREHVEPSGAHRQPAALEERPAAPQHDRRGQQPLEPPDAGTESVMQIHAWYHVGHRHDEHRQREGETDPEAAGHVDEFRVGLLLGADRERLERHATHRAAARSHLPYLGVHRAGVDGAGRCCGRRRTGWRWWLAQVGLRRRAELVAALRVAEVVGLPVVHVGAALGLRGIHAHPADRIAGLLLVRDIHGAETVVHRLRYLEDSHHAEVFVLDDVAVVDRLAVKIGEWHREFDAALRFHVDDISPSGQRFAACRSCDRTWNG